MAWVYYLLFFFIVFSTVMAFTKPDCRAGTVAMIGVGTGWVCVDGYKP